MNSAKNTYPIMERFHTIQGEGGYTGSSAYFIRIAGCDVGCSWCDVKESWDASEHQMIKVNELSRDAKESGSDIVVVTGGEPMMYDNLPLTVELQKLGLRTHLETSGVYKVSGNWDWICFSPKKFKEPQSEIYDKCNELKIIVANKHDLIWAEKHAEKANKDCLLFLQPEWNKQEQIIPIIISYMRDHPKWRLSLQMHKYIGVL